jgi:hypothetical protein
MAKTSEPKKISEKKLDRAAQALQEITEKIAAYEREWKLLTPQEKAVAGGVVFHIVCAWNDFSLIGTVVDRALGAKLVNVLVNFYNNPPRSGQGAKMKIPSITPASTKTNEFPN